MGRQDSPLLCTKIEPKVEVLGQSWPVRLKERLEQVEEAQYINKDQTSLCGT